MSFRNRLSLYFAGLVIVPMAAAAVVVILLLAYSDRSRTDARVAEGQTAAIGLYRREVARAARGAARAGRDPVLTRALVTGNAPAVRTRARQLLASGPARRLRLSRGRRLLADVGPDNAVAPASRRLLGPSGATVGRVEASVITASAYARLVKSVTGLETIVRRGGRTLGASRSGIPPGTLPDVGDATIAGRDFRVASFDTVAFAGQKARVSVLSNRAATAPALTGTRVLGAAVALAVFLAVAFGLAMVVSRSLQAQIGRFLEGARRLAAGDFSTEVPTQGHDEFAALGAEFNKMSHQLESRLEELHQERARLEDSIGRIGETFASGLDRIGLLEILVRTSLDAVNADCGRASVREGPEAPLRQVAVSGDLGVHGEVLHAVEVLAHDSGRPESTDQDGHSALAYPVAPREGEESALLSVARIGRPFSQRERELFNYLAGQMAISMENVGLHELVQRQALTDDLTGLSNHRRFQDVIEAEVGRGKRFEHSVGLIMLDIDDFKQINDTYGHQQGDLVLSEVGRVVRAGSRDIDEPARYGGEELAVALPETDLDGAYLLAERMRLAIEALEIPRLDGNGVLRVTASFGAAALPDSADDRSALVAAADAALYRAKRAGKNRTEVAGRLAASTASGE